MHNDAAFTNIDEYIAQFSPEIQEKLELLRQTIREAAPEAREAIAYMMPAFQMGGPLVYFACFKKHIGFFPTSTGVAAFLPELGEYKVSKGTIQLPLDKPLPLELISRIVTFKVAELQAKVATKKVKKA